MDGVNDAEWGGSTTEASRSPESYSSTAAAGTGGELGYAVDPQDNDYQSPAAGTVGPGKPGENGLGGYGGYTPAPQRSEAYSSGLRAPGTTRDQFFDDETPAERDARMGKISGFFTDAAHGLARGLIPGVGLGEKLGLFKLGETNDPDWATRTAGGTGTGGSGRDNQFAQNTSTGLAPKAAIGMVTDPNAPTAWFTANKGASDVKIRRAQDANKWSNEDVAKAIGADTGKWSARYNAATPYVNFAGLFDNVLAGDFVNPLAENS